MEHTLQKDSLRTSLERIETWLEREAPRTANSLQPGITREQMLQILGPKSDRFQIPEEVVELYNWRNGQSAGNTFFDVLRFQPFEEAVEYGNLVEEYFDGTFPLLIFQEICYDAGYQAKCGSDRKPIAPAYRWDHGDERVETTSFADLFLAIAEGFEGNAFWPNESGAFETDEEVWNATLVRHNPERSRCVAHVLARHWTDLNTEELSCAFYDLVRMKHPQISELIREFLERIQN